jgi:hypothetical protein
VTAHPTSLGLGRCQKYFFEKVVRALPFIKRESERNYKPRLHTLNRTGPATKERKEEQGEATSPALGGQVSQ